MLQSAVTSFLSIDDSLALVAPPNKGSPTARMYPNLLYARLPKTHKGFVVLFDGTAKTENSRTWCKRRDWRFEVRNTLGALACRKESLMNQLSRHKEVTARLKSMKYFHMTREYNAAADSLTTETAAFKTSKVVLSESQKAELREFNRIPEVIYHKSREAEVKILVSTASIQFTETVHRPTRRMIANFVRDEPHMEPHMVMATPRSQTGARKKRVRFANEVPSQDAGSQENMSHKTDRPTDDSQDEQQTGAAQAPPSEPNS
ncbi:hypothetical protein PPTG_18338 [Phytophthora nicotianae INRA-310]|uniref:RNase H type-1 domain-containing protein n=2 Tax=Phytophthora nicotianae TaxID=4792 RepID=W2PGA6_PHYN3|nr:hypothetical protein PPTG_18338 [Phytophthora nicotianae INRA-310]ETN00068.1 hypothetical protein PPTG_18338 [Phytophthora nicotianae INRA-310]